jgi:two-component system, cell cycle sensor histidine kinase and response regulator CckA
MATARVLIVDDEPAVVRLVSRTLAVSGYEVLSAGSPGEALDMVYSAPPIDLLISDVVMPEMRGPELVRAFTERSPSTAAMLMSAYADGHELPPDVPFIQKPFVAKDLVAAVEQILERWARRGRGRKPMNGG